VNELPSNAEATEDKESEIALQTFLQDVAPNQERRISGMAEYSRGDWYFVRPDVTLFCSDEICGRGQSFSCIDQELFLVSQNHDFVLHYECRNCERTTKTFAIRLVKDLGGGDGCLVKMGEEPAFGPPLPARLQRLVQRDRDLLIKGYQSEIHGQGIGAFAYYRRVVEDGKDRLIDEIIKVCRKIPGADKFISGLEEAKKQTQFKKAVEQIADAIPDALRIEGHNPLTLLHQAISKSLHSDSDEECLEAAEAIRVVLTEFADRLSQLLKEQAELTNAIKKLFAGKSPTKGKQKEKEVEKDPPASSPASG
jgi:hypothetical protein